jgi:hypothetical protein
MFITQLQPKLIKIKELSKFNGQLEKVSIGYLTEDYAFKIFPMGKFLKKELEINDSLILEGADGYSNYLFWYCKNTEKYLYIPLRGEILNEESIKIEEGCLELLTCYVQSDQKYDKGCYLQVMKLEADFVNDPLWTKHKKVDLNF